MRIDLDKYKYRITVVFIVLILQLGIQIVEFYIKGAIDVPHIAIISVIYLILAYLVGLSYDKKRIYLLQIEKNEYLLRKQLESENKFRKVFDNANDGMYLTYYRDGNWRFNDVNKKALDILGYNKQEFLKLALKDISEKDYIIKLHNGLNYFLSSN